MVPVLVTACVWSGNNEDYYENKLEHQDQIYLGELWISLEEMSVYNRKLTFTFVVGQGVSELSFYRDDNNIASIKVDSDVQDFSLKEGYGFGQLWLLIQLAKIVEGAILILNNNLLYSTEEVNLAILKTSIRVLQNEEERAHELVSMMCRQTFPK